MAPPGFPLKRWNTSSRQTALWQRRPFPPISQELRTIASNIADLIQDGDTSQLGFGGLPHAVAENLMRKKDLGVHTEMFSTSLYHLMDAGVVTNDRKSINRGKSICAFCWGDDEFNRYIDFNPGIQVLPLTHVKQPQHHYGKRRDVVPRSTPRWKLT